MVSEKDFLKFIDKVKLNMEALEKLSDAVGPRVWENGLSCLSNSSDSIAGLLMDIKIENNESFSQDYWNMIDEGKSDFKIYDRNCVEVEHIFLNSWSDFYKYWRKIAEENYIT